MGSKALARACVSLMVLAMLAGCHTVEYIPQEAVRTDSIYISQVKWDSVYVQDSIYVREKGDTIFVDKMRYKYIERYLHDTLWRERIDSVAVPYPVAQPLSRMEKLRMKVGGLALSGIFVLSLVGVFLLILRRLKL